MGGSPSFRIFGSSRRTFLTSPPRPGEMASLGAARGHPQTFFSLDFSDSC